MELLKKQEQGAIKITQKIQQEKNVPKQLAFSFMHSFATSSNNNGYVFLSVPAKSTSLMEEEKPDIMLRKNTLQALRSALLGVLQQINFIKQ